MSAVEVQAAGLVTAVGLTAAASAAALRARIMRFRETPFLDAGGSPVIGAPIRGMADGELGTQRLATLLCAALDDAARQLGEPIPDGTPLVLGLAERERAGRPPGLESQLADAIVRDAGWRFDEATSSVVATGNTSGARAFELARRVLERGAPRVVVACVDSFLNAPALAQLQAAERLKTEDDPDGVIPGEAAGALVLGAALDGARSRARLAVAGAGFARESAAADRARPNTGVGLAAAIRACLSDARAGTRNTDFRLSDVSGERRAFVETQYAMSRTLAESHADYPLWLPAESFGEIGAASVPAQLAVAAASFAKGYAPGRAALCQSGSADGDRAVLFAVALAG